MSATAAVRRLLVLVPWLLERPGAHVEEAAAAVGTDRSTILSDLSLLDFCGLPGRLGGDMFETELVGDRIVLRLAPAFERPLRPTATEALGLVLSLDGVANALGDDLAGLREAVETLREAAGVPAGVRVVDDEVDARLGDLRDALTRRRVVELRYAGRGDDVARTRRVDPWELVHHRGEWYLLGHDHDAGSRRTFRLDRVLDVSVTDQSVRVVAPDEPLAPPTYVPGPDDERIELLVRPAGSWVLDVLSPDEVIERGDGSVLAVVSTDVPSWVVRTVLAARGEVTVVGPASVRDSVVETARRGLRAYADAPAAAPR